MSNVIPPLVSSSPPPMLPEDDEDDDFGDFAAANDYSYDDGLSLPTTPQRSIDPPLIAYPNLSENSTSSNDDEIKEPQIEFKDNASQDSVLSIVTSDSGLSEIHSSSSDDVMPEIETTENRDNVEQSNDKDFLDVRNEDIVETVYDSDIIHSKSNLVLDNVYCNINENTMDFSDNQIENDNNERNLFDEGSKSEEHIHTTNQFENFQDTNDQEMEPALSENVENQFVNVIEPSLDVPERLSPAEDSFDDEFVEFKSHETFQNSATPPQVEEDDDDFGDFEDCRAQDDEDDFADFSVAPVETPPVVESTPKLDDQKQLEIINLFSKKPNRSEKETLSTMVREIFKQAFPGEASDIQQEEVPNLLKDCQMWERLDDVENLKPLTFRWENTTTYQKYLQTINMDTRNILYGSNLNMPRFAANLGGSPLEPLKPTTAATTSQSNGEPSTKMADFLESKSSVEVTTPTVALPPQFDWNNSMPYTPNNSLLNLEDLINSLNASTSVSSEAAQSSGQTDTTTMSDIDAWEYWTQCSAKEPENSTIKQETTVEINKETGLTPPSIEPAPAKIQPEIEPESPSLLDASKNETVAASSDDEFSDFYSVAPPPVAQTLTPVGFTTPMNLRETHISTEPEGASPAWLQPTMLTPELTRKTQEPKIEAVEDDFTDFQFAETTPVAAQITPVVPLEPIKVEPVISARKVEINWPDPGISEDDLQRLSNLRIDTIKEVHPPAEAVESKADQDDGWSDFVSTPVMSSEIFSDFETNCSNTLILKTVHAVELKSAISNQNSDLLPPKVDVRAPQIVPNVALPYRTTDCFSSTNFTSNQNYNSSTSAVSNKHFNSGDFAQLTTAQPPVQNVQFNNIANSAVEKSKNIDDDWSDFVSNRDSVNQYTNGWNPVKRATNYWADTPNFPSWNAPSSFTPNIITNPGHFDSSTKYYQNSNYYHAPASTFTNNASPMVGTVKPMCITTKSNKMTHTTTAATLQTMKGKNSVATISALPDLDFMVPKWRSTKGVKK